MAPEQARGDVEQIDERSDVFGLGAVLQSVVAARVDVEHGQERPPRPLVAVWQKAMAPLPEHRYSSAQALAADVARFLDGQPVEAYREPLVERARRVITKYQTPILLILAYLAMRILLLVTRGI
jgi:hypothetical protein